MGLSEKIRLEHQAARLFMRAYEKQHAIKMRHIWHNEPQKPDVSCYWNDHKLDLEIAHLYGSTEEAKQLLGRELSDKTQLELQHLSLTPPDHRLLEALNRLLANKAEKHYESENTWLVIRNTHPAWQRQDFETRCHHIILPQKHPFEQVWLLGDMAGESGIIRLDA
ncbi:hypothetical protein JX580_06815 [Thiomicrospira microaerophila]|uniref:hypothetical protein n=1 Tax=Thiomicrospira microaerophila TaxID=406020 RepID=UPI00200DF2F2|nr:hypothetical protein [Thiomicrospira microaerophila]UQB41404.1 hypothetical protein JX580_06815 [Thiomicrospira microaerophila]